VILGDPSIWVDHLRRRNAASLALLDGADVAADPFVVGELACGSLRRQRDVIALRSALPRVTTATHDEVRHFISAQRLGGHGIGSVAPASIDHIRVWTRDKALAAQAASRGLAFDACISRGGDPSRGRSQQGVHQGVGVHDASLHQGVRGLDASIHQGVGVLDASIHQGVNPSRGQGS